MDHVFLNRDGNAEPYVDQDLEWLNEQLNEVDHYLEMVPSESYATDDRDKLEDQRDHLLQMIEQKFLEGETDSNTPNAARSNDSSSSTTSLSPSISGQPGPSNSASISGFSTPDFFSGRGHNLFASVTEEDLPDTTRMAQEIA